MWDPCKQNHKNKLAVQHRAARFVCKDTRTNSVSSMITKLCWKSLEARWAASRLTHLYKSIHHIAAIDSNQYQTKPPTEGIRTRTSSAISSSHPITKNDCYKYSFLPRTMAEWRHLSISLAVDICFGIQPSSIRTRCPSQCILGLGLLEGNSVHFQTAEF